LLLKHLTIAIKNSFKQKYNTGFTNFNNLKNKKAINMKKKIDTSEILEEIIAEIEFLIEDSSIPKNLKLLLNGIEARLTKKEDVVEISSILYQLEEITNNNNVPQFCRSAVWSLISKLEKLKETIK